MNTQFKTFTLRHLIVMTAAGTVDLIASQAALKSLVANPGFDASSEVLLDLRGGECALSVTDIYKLVEHIALHLPALSINHRIAVLVDRHTPGNLAFNHAQFLELCADNRGFNIRAYEDFDPANEWLIAVLPHAEATALKPTAALASGRRPQFGIA